MLSTTCDEAADTRAQPQNIVLCSRKDHRTATLRVCFHALQLTKLIERANRNQFEAHEVGRSQR